MPAIADSDIRGVDLNLLLVLAVLLEERSVTRTARRLGLTQSTVSGMLARLREALGDPLFVRSQRGMLPTPRAEAMAGPLRAWIAEAQTLIVPAAFDPGHWRGSVALASTDFTQHVLFEPFLRTLRERAPQLRVALHPLVFEEVAERIGRGVFDLAVSVSGWVPADLPSLALSKERYVLAMWTGHELAGRRRIGVDHFCAHDHVIVSPSGGGFTGPVDEALAKLGRHRRVRLSVPSFSLAVDLLAGSDLLCVLPERMARGRADIRTCRPPFATREVEMVAVWHPRFSDDPGHRWLRETLAETARSV